MSKIFFLILVAILSIKYILFWTYVWQLKEYRWDRFYDFLRSREGKDAFLNKFYLAKIVCAVLGFISFGLIFFTMGLGGGGLAYEKAKILIFISNVILIIIFFLLFCELFIYLNRVLSKRAKCPIFTKKALLLILISGIINFYFILLCINWDKEFFAPLSLVILMYIPLFTGLANLIIYPFSQFFKNRKVEAAGRIMEKFDGTVIGITGSYGKSSVKEFTAALLEKKFDILKTPKNVNTEIGVAGYIISTPPCPPLVRGGGFPLLYKPASRLRRQVAGREGLEPALPVRCFGGSLPKGVVYDFFICEMGAYKIGEIEKLCKMVKPKIGILTGINEQHLALFGNIENTIKAKSELINSLPSDGLAIINWDDENCRKVVIPDGVRKITYGFAENADVKILVGDRKDGIVGELKFVIEFKTPLPPLCKGGNYEIKVKCKIIGRHNILNLLPAIIVAKNFGMSWDEIKAAVEELRSLDSGMKIKEVKNSIIIDDTYNSNPAGVRAALEILDGMDKKYKVLVLDDIWELGKDGERIHSKLAEEIAHKNYDKIILVGKEYAELMKKVMVENGVENKKIVLGGDRTIFTGGEVVLFEGRRAEKEIEKLRN